jgi:hypothetical protein
MGWRLISLKVLQPPLKTWRLDNLVSHIFVIYLILVEANHRTIKQAPPKRWWQYFHGCTVLVTGPC